MTARLAERGDPRLRDVLGMSLSMAGLAACVTLVFLAMRAVMNIGGACADGGPYVPAQPCPDGVPAAMVLGMLGLFAFGGLGIMFGSRLGGPWAGVPMLGWPALFGSLGFNFIDYGILNPPEGQGIVWGWLVTGIVFELMAAGPLALGLASLPSRPGRARGDGTGAAVTTAALARPPGAASSPAGPVGRPVAAGAGTPAGAAAMSGDPAGALREIATAIGAAVDQAAATASPAGPATASWPSGTWSEGPQALLDRLERLADMHDRGQLSDTEYAAAKDLVMRELESRR
jgi:hypothetical protein